MPQFCILLYANHSILATRGGAMAPCPPLNTPLDMGITHVAFDVTVYCTNTVLIAIER